MKTWEFLIREAINTPEMELKIRAVFSENTALHEEVSQLKDENAILKTSGMVREAGLRSEE